MFMVLSSWDSHCNS